MSLKRYPGGSMRRTLYAVIWIIVYLALTMAPLFALMVGVERPGRGFWREFSVALGFAGLAMIGLQFLLTARFRSIVRPYGVDVVYHFHRQISLVAFAFILAHPLILFIESPETVALLNVFTAPLRAVFGVTSLLALLVLVVFSVFRLNIGLRYEPWRISHGILATAAVTLALLHVVGVGYYIDTTGKQALWLILGFIWVGSLVYIRVIKPLLLLRRPYLVESITPERGDTYTVAFKAEGHSGMKFRPGQFAWLTIWSSPFAIAEHPFSISSSALESDTISMTIKELGDFTSKVKNIVPGTRAYLDGPYGVFSIDNHPAPGFVFIAGGIGITPIISMLRTMADRKDMRPIILIYGNKTWEDMSFREEIEGLKTKLNLKVVHILEEPPSAWDGESGFVNAKMLAKYLPVDRMELMYFLCGPELMMDAVETALDSLGITSERMTAERFNLI
jgi:predicted ferric reductase